MGNYESKYNDLINRLRKAKEDDSVNDDRYCCVIDDIVPELKESVDEKIRKVIYGWIYTQPSQFFDSGFSKEEMLAWLEKQSEKKPVIEMKTPEESLGIDSDTYNKIVDECIYGEQNPAWSEEDELHIRELESLVKQAWAIAEHENDKETIHKMSNLSFFLKTLKPQPKQEWKQENTGDLTDFENAMMHIGESFFGDNAGLDPNDTNAIKEQANLLLELVPKQGWSDVDKDILFRITDNLKFLRDTISIDPKYAVNIIDIEREITWLKDLKDRVQSQNMWKPNEEQMNAFDAVLVYNPPCSNECRNHLITLYNELKKLKEE